MAVSTTKINSTSLFTWIFAHRRVSFDYITEHGRDCRWRDVVLSHSFYAEFDRYLEIKILYQSLKQQKTEKESTITKATTKQYLWLLELKRYKFYTRRGERKDLQIGQVNKEEGLRRLDRGGEERERRGWEVRGWHVRGWKKRTLSDRRIQGNGEINFHSSQFQFSLFFSFLPSPCTGFVRRVWPHRWRKSGNDIMVKWEWLYTEKKGKCNITIHRTL